MAVVAPGTLACPRCGEAQPSGARFCMRCGLSLAEGGSPEPAAPLQVAPPVAPAIPPPAVPSPAPAMAIPAASIAGRQGSRLGWVGAVAGAPLFLAASVAVLAAAGPPDPMTPTAHWDSGLHKPGSISSGEPFDVSVEAANPGAASTDRLWLVIEWRPSGARNPESVTGSLVACQPVDCEYRNDAAAGVTVVVWPGLPAGTHHVYRATLEADGISAVKTLTLRVTAGTGAAESRLRDSVRWTSAIVVQ